jgi:hypothetical protein
MTRKQFDIQHDRLERAINVLRDNGCYMQAVARAYYIVHSIAVFAADEYQVEVIHRRQGESFFEGKFSHNETVDLVKALYSGQNSGNVKAGNATGVITSPKMSPADAARRTNALQKVRKLADYGPTNVLEPFSEVQVDEYLAWANDLTEDIRKLL